MTEPATTANIPGRRLRTRAAAPANTAVAYLRVSTDEQARSGLGLDDQRAKLQAEADNRGWQIVAWYSDEGVSGGTAPAKRPGLSAALQAVQGREAATLMALKIDRLSRSMADAGTLLDQAAREGWQIFTADLAADTTTPAGRAQAGMMITFSEYERNLISTRTRDALAALKARGVQLGQPSKVPDETITRVILEMADGRSLRAIAGDLTAEGIPTSAGKSTWSAQQVKRAADCTRGREIAAQLFPEGANE